jgi:hypothetical protein
MGINLPAGAGNVVPDVAPMGTRQLSDALPTPLQQAWGIADERATVMLEARQRLTVALNTVPNQPIAFGAAVFSGCALGGLEATTGPGPITVSPASINIEADTAATATAVLEGAAPFSVFDNGLATKPTITGDRLTVTVAAKEATPDRVITTPIGNLFGQTALFTIRVKGTEAPAARDEAAGPGGTELVFSDDLRRLQTELNERDDLTLKTDGFLGPETRRAVIDELETGRIGKVTSHVNDSSLETPECTAAVKALRAALDLLPGAPSESVAMALKTLYSEDEYVSVTRIEADEVLSNYVSQCGIAP